MHPKYRREASGGKTCIRALHCITDEVFLPSIFVAYTQTCKPCYVCFKAGIYVRTLVHAHKLASEEKL